MAADDLRALTYSLTSRLLDDETLRFEDVATPELMAAFDSSDPFLSDVYDDILDALGTKPTDVSLLSRWREDYEVLDVLLGHHLLKLQTPTSELARLRDAVRAKRPASRREVLTCVAELAGARTASDS